MQRDVSATRTPHSSDKVRLKQTISKSLSKSGLSGFNTPSPIIKSKFNLKQSTELGIIKQKIKRKAKQQKKPKQKKMKQEVKQKEPKQNTKIKKKTNFGTCLKELKPLNLQKEKQLFFESNGKRNPFFVYPNISDIMDEQYKQNLKYNTLNSEYLSLALRILDKGKEIDFTTLLKRGDVLTMEETCSIFDQYINKLEISELLNYEFVQNTISETSVIHNNVQSISTVIIGLPIRYTKHTIDGVLNHQIGTHFLRKYNDRTQKWFKERKKFNLGHYLQTEEGLAALNQLLPFVLQGTMPALLYRPSLLYYSCYLASQVSFCQLFQLLENYQPDPQLRWKLCVRVKRGVADTKKSGGMYKDQIYFIGAINVLRNRKKLNFVQLFCGKINVQDCLKLSEKGQISYNQKIKLPTFINDIKTYMKCLDHIAEINQIK